MIETFKMQKINIIMQQLKAQIHMQHKQGVWEQKR